ncbi:16S rRNA (cytosine(1407)-C(5))-methyltransferase RsmF [Paraferrimonas sp. SM1919]|uniref:16S rRNA (cytosine(1407)-C(5))-methyltransferase RsmF n=1 Tax=Paraferrimonas sp. SM1919 TaxID=2662263 RepID=UPI0013D417E1|nr:16S rRNA (cytosine(1407)-C(5))-methyltransferase RsmF [Paraferrimonas sp. SM1919]
MPLLPQEFIEHMRAIHPEPTHFQKFLDICQVPLRRSIRVNTDKITIAEFLNIAKLKDWQLTPIPWCDNGFWINDNNAAQSLGNSIEHLGGLFYIQEASSMLPPIALLAETELNDLNTLLDMASAPGSKTTQLVNLVPKSTAIIANELSASRLKTLHANLQRMGAYNVALTNFDASVFGLYAPESFDAILLDAPCGGEGAIRKDEHALANWSEQHIDEISALQRQLIESAFSALKVGASMVYSTCTLNERENQQVCRFLRDKYPQQVEFTPLNNLFDGAEQAITAEGFLHVWPETYDSEGFFVAKIKKLGSIPELQGKKAKIKPTAFKPMSATSKKQFSQAFSQQFSIDVDQFGLLTQRDAEIWLHPLCMDQLYGKVKYQRIGIKLAEELKKGYKFEHDCYQLLKPENCFSLSLEQAQHYLQGKDITIEQKLSPGEMGVCYQNMVLGLVKPVQKKLKNKLPRVLIKDHLNFNN